MKKYNIKLITRSILLFISACTFILVMTTHYCFADKKESEDDLGYESISRLRKYQIFEAKKEPRNDLIYEGVDNPYIAESDFKCGNYDVHVTTSCRKIDEKEARAICYTQHFEFSLGKDKTKDFFLFNPDFRTEMMIAVNTTCFTASTHHFLIITSSNFTNGMDCKNCERRDYFDESANYMGSSVPSTTGSKIVSGYKKMSISMYKKLDRLFPDKETTGQEFKIKLYPSMTGDK